MKTIIVEISTTGEVKIDAVGFKGKACTQATNAIEIALGKTTAKTIKPEYNQIEIQQKTKAAR